MVVAFSYKNVFSLWTKSGILLWGIYLWSLTLEVKVKSICSVSREIYLHTVARKLYDNLVKLVHPSRCSIFAEGFTLPILTANHWPPGVGQLIRICTLQIHIHTRLENYWKVLFQTLKTAGLCWIVLIGIIDNVKENIFYNCFYCNCWNKWGVRQKNDEQL